MYPCKYWKFDEEKDQEMECCSKCAHWDRSLKPDRNRVGREWGFCGKDARDYKGKVLMRGDCPCDSTHFLAKSSICDKCGQKVDNE